MTCACVHDDAGECLRTRAPWVDSDDTRVECRCSCHRFATIDLAHESLDEDEAEGMAAE